MIGYYKHLSVSCKCLILLVITLVHTDHIDNLSTYKNVVSHWGQNIYIQTFREGGNIWFRQVLSYR